MPEKRIVLNSSLNQSALLPPCSTVPYSETIIGLLTLGGLLALEYWGHGVRNDIAQYHSLWMYSSLVGLMLASLTVTRFYESLHRQATQRIEEERRFSNSAINSLPGVFYLLDTNGRFRRWNENLEKALGVTGEELSGAYVIKFVHRGDRRKAIADVRQILKQGELNHEIIDYPNYMRRVISGHIPE